MPSAQADGSDPPKMPDDMRLCFGRVLNLSDVREDSTAVPPNGTKIASMDLKTYHGATYSGLVMPPYNEEVSTLIDLRISQTIPGSNRSQLYGAYFYLDGFGRVRQNTDQSYVMLENKELDRDVSTKLAQFGMAMKECGMLDMYATKEDLTALFTGVLLSRNDPQPH